MVDNEQLLDMLQRSIDRDAAEALLAHLSGGSSPVADYFVGTAAAVSDDFASLNLLPIIASGMAAETGDWAISVDTFTVLPPRPGVYAVHASVYASGTLDEPVEVALLAVGETANQGAVANVPAGASNTYAAPASRIVIITDAVTEPPQGITLKGSFPNNAPTTGGADVQLWIARLGDVPA